jgi:hypothetical protein
MATPGIPNLLEGIFFGEDVGWTGATLGETPNLGLPDRTMATHCAILPLWGIILENSPAGCGFVVEWCVPSRINDGGSWWRGAAKA